jgi:hypothetical protein
MVYRSELNNWKNGNYSDLDRVALVRIASYFNICVNSGIERGEQEIIEDTEETEED